MGPGCVVFQPSTSSTAPDAFRYAYVAGCHPSATQPSSEVEFDRIVVAARRTPRPGVLGCSFSLGQQGLG